MQIYDIETIPVTDNMRIEAKEESDYLNKYKTGAKTRLTIENHDIYGSLGHQAVEKLLDKYHTPYTSYRKTKYQKGDEMDIQFDSYNIDVKATHGIVDQWFYNKRFLVFQKQLDDPKIELISHFVFSMVNPNLEEVYIFGYIPVEEFLEKCTPVKLKFDNQAIISRQLYPIKKLILHL